ncbi:hypothetical protein B188_26370 [Candidatus Brocadiaceae bacterium B188]|nr:hypothetical protein B188_26370 [Candidatus Brocadiaceae bacterium B188]
MNLQLEIDKYKERLYNHRKQFRRFNPEQLTIGWVEERNPTYKTNGGIIANGYSGALSS